MTDDNTPILVIVKDGGYICRSLQPIASPRDTELARVLKEDMGGVAEGTVDGVYIFNVEIIEGTHSVVSLEFVN